MIKVNNSFIGLDVHKDSIVAAVMDDLGKVVFEKSFPGCATKLLRELLRLAKEGPLSCCYEAGPTGFELQRRLEKAGIDCVVVAPSLIPRKPGERIKTDRRDARKLAEYLRAGQLTAVCPPSEDEEALRDLCRCRSQAATDLTRARHRFSKFLLRRGHVYREGGNWTVKHAQWMRRIDWGGSDCRAVFGSYLRAIEHLEDRIRDLDTTLEEAAQRDPYREPVGWLRCFRGIDTVTAVTLVSELFQIMRFHSPRELMAFLGLVPSEKSTGHKRRQGAITKTGNRHVRKLLVQVAWHYRHRASVSKALRERRTGQPDEIIALADRAQHRLNRRFIRLTMKSNKPSQVAVVAVARELAGFIWAALHQYPLLQQQQQA